MSIDKRAFLNEFREEAKGYLLELNDNLLILGKNPCQLDSLQKMRKGIHTLKGAARMLGFKEIAEITHSMEFIFEEAANKKIAVNSLIVNTLFICFDLLQILIEKLTAGESPELELNVICEGLIKISKNEPGMETFPEGLKIIVEKVAKKGKSSGITGNKMMPGAEETIKVKSARIDKLLGLSGEIIIDKIKSEELLKRMRVLLADIETKKMQGIESQARDCYKECEFMTNHMGLTIDKLQQEILSLRMLPLNTIFEIFPRAVRDIAQQYDKKISLEIRGGDAELDKKMLEDIKEPLMHIIRNAIGHGIETERDRKRMGKPDEGKIIITAWQEGSHVFITVEDDGKGIDPQLIKDTVIKKKIITQEEADELTEREIVYLIFSSNVSTTEEVNELSGRGVGMGIVKEKVEALKGEVNLESRINKGAKFIIKLPLTLSVTSALMLKSASKCFAIPSANIDVIAAVKPEDIKYVEEKPVITLGRRIIPLVDLKDALDLPEEGTVLEKKKYFVVVISYKRQRKGFIVDEVISEDEIVIKNLGGYLGNVKNITGATILVNGDIVLLLNIPDLMCAPIVEAKIFKKSADQKTILIVEDSLTAREMERSILETIGYTVIVAGDGLEALERLALEKVDLVIADIQMPNMDGWELTRKLKQDEKYKNLPIIMVTSLENPEDKKKGIDLGANAYIMKSEFEQDRFVQLIETFIG
ncbi:MAG: hybrid sensor histidine kinase/response regulator [bacterium]